MICIDLDPRYRARHGRVVEFWHEWEDRPVRAKTFEHYLTKAMDLDLWEQVPR